MRAVKDSAHAPDPDASAALGERVRAHVYVSGRVQGVYYRAAARDAALLLGVTGWVRNLPDGRVEAVFEGDEDAVEAAGEWCRHGPPAAEVISVDVVGENTEGLEGFAIR